MKDELLKILSNAATTQLALESIRANETDRALEFLEMNLDASVLSLNGLAKEVEPTERERVISTLRMIRDYRRVHPRRVEADLSTVANGVAVHAARAAQERIPKILKEIK
jgi:hypothetical protein